jgi:hypothetical protein
MLERLAAILSRLVQGSKTLVGRARERTRPHLFQLRADARRGLADALSPFEALLLSAAARERMHASAVFALIFAFAVTSVDFMLSGGFDFAERPQARQTAYQSLISPRIELASLPADEEDAIAPEAILPHTPRARVTQTAFEPQIAPSLESQAPGTAPAEMEAPSEDEA